MSETVSDMVEMVQQAASHVENGPIYCAWCCVMTWHRVVSYPGWEALECIQCHNHPVMRETGEDKTECGGSD